MTRWEVERSSDITSRSPRTYAVVKVGDGGERREVRERWSRLSCIDAQVIAEELNRAYDLGRREVFAQGIGD